MSDPPKGPAHDPPEAVAARLLESAAALEEAWRYATDPARVGPGVIRRLRGTAAAESFLAGVGPCVLGLREMAREVAPGVLRRVEDLGPGAAADPTPDGPPPPPDNTTPEGVERIVSALESAAVVVTPAAAAAWTGEQLRAALRWAEDTQTAGVPRPGRPDFLPEPWRAP